MRSIVGSARLPIRDREGGELRGARSLEQLSRNSADRYQFSSKDRIQLSEADLNARRELKRKKKARERERKREREKESG